MNLNLLVDLAGLANLEVHPCQEFLGSLMVLWVLLHHGGLVTLLYVTKQMEKLQAAIQIDLSEILLHSSSGAEHKHPGSAARSRARQLRGFTALHPLW